MNAQLGIILVISLAGLLFLPIYSQNRKLRRYADEDLKTIDRSEWRKQLEWNAYSKFLGRVIWGVILLAIFVRSFWYKTNGGLELSQMVALLFGLCFLIYGFGGLSHDKSKLPNVHNADDL